MGLQKSTLFFYFIYFLVGNYKSHQFDVVLRMHVVNIILNKYSYFKTRHCTKVIHSNISEILPKPNSKLQQSTSCKELQYHFQKTEWQNHIQFNIKHKEEGTVVHLVKNCYWY